MTIGQTARHVRTVRVSEAFSHQAAYWAAVLYTHICMDYSTSSLMGTDASNSKVSR